ncbi:MAG: TonB-dependent receptor [Acidobacteriota bacterium]
MLRRIGQLWLLPVLMLIIAIPALGQSIDGTLAGKLVDTSGAVIAGATLKVSNKVTGLSFDTTTSEQGFFRLEHLPVGKYSVTTEAAGFKRVSVDVNIQLNAVADVIITLEAGGIDDVVTIDAGEILVETSTSSLNNSFNDRKVIDLPNPAAGGSELNLALLAPNVSSQSGGVVGAGGSIGGNRPRNNNFTIDGVDNNDISVTGPVIAAIPEAVQEFTLLTNQYTAEFGRASAGQFNTITKSGTNEIHGSANLVVNNKHFNSFDTLTKEGIANGALPDLKPRFDNVRTSGTVGGPIIKNKLFYFGAFQYQTQGTAGDSSSFLAPTATGLAMLSSLRGVSPFTLNILRSSVPAAPIAEQTITAFGQEIPVGTLNVLVPSFLNQYTFNVNIDQVIGNNDQLRYRFNYDRLRTPLPGFPDPKFNGSQKTDNRLFSFTFVHTFTPTVVNEFRLAYRRQNAAFAVPTAFPEFPVGDFPNINIDDIGLSIGPDGNSPQSNIANSYQLVNNISFTRGKHNFKAGIDFRNNIAPSNFLPRGRGEYDYATLEEFLRDDKPTGFNGGLRGVGESTFAGNQSSYYFFFQDDIRVTPNLTLNLGLRYEYNGLARDERLQARNAFASIPGVIEFKVPETDKNDFAPRIGLAYSPNFDGGIGGFLFGKNGQGAIRAGFAIGYDIIFQNLPSLQLPPQFQQESSVGSDPIPNFLQSGGLVTTPVPPITAADARSATQGLIRDHISPYTMSYTIDYQRQFLNKWSIDVRYLGTRAVKQFVQVRLNGGFPPFDIAGFSLPTYLSASQVPDQRTLDTMPTLNDLTAFSVLGNGIGGLGPQAFEFSPFVTSFPGIGDSFYHAGSVQVQRRFEDGFTMSAAYTYSHTLDNVTNELFTSFINPRRLQNGFDTRDNYGNSALDRPHRFVASAIWDLPFFRNANGLKRTLLGGWEIDLIYTAESGQPFSALSATDSNLNADSAGDRTIRNPNGVKGTGSGVTPVTNSNGQVVGYLATNGNAEYIQAGRGARTNSGPNTLRAPGFNNWDIAVVKNFKVGEKYNVRFRVDMFNAFNHPQFTVGGGTVFQQLGNALNLAYANASSPSFNNERIFSSRPRIINMTLRVTF